MNADRGRRMRTVDKDDRERGASPRGTMTLIVETEDGVFARTVQPASVLPPSAEHGPAAEMTTRGAAALWGLPDFVFRAEVQSRPGRTREIGDAILVVGERGAVVQVKSRRAPYGSATRERSWIEKSVRHGAAQAAGTVRVLGSGTLRLMNERGRHLAIRPDKWLKVVVLDHPGVEDCVPPRGPVVLLRRDWEFLFEQLRSTFAVLQYIERVSAMEPVALGQEPIRYYQLARADRSAPPGLLDARLAALGATPMSVPMLPQAPSGHSPKGGHSVIRHVLEDLATVGSIDEDIRLQVLSVIDRIPVGYRAELGREILGWLDEVGSVEPPAVNWRVKGVPQAGQPYLLIAAASRFSAEVQRMFEDLLSLRHQQVLEVMPENSAILTVGILLTPRRDGLRWDTTLAATRGDQGFDDRYRQLLEAVWGVLGTRTGSPDLVEIARLTESLTQSG